MNRIKYYLGEFYDKQIEIKKEDIPINKSTILLNLSISNSLSVITYLFYY